MKTSILILAVLLVQGVLSNTLNKKNFGGRYIGGRYGNDNFNDGKLGVGGFGGNLYDNLDDNRNGGVYVGGERTNDDLTKVVGVAKLGGVNGKNMYVDFVGKIGVGKNVFNDNEGKIGGGRLVGVGGGRNVFIDDEGNIGGGRTNYEGKFGGGRRNIRSLNGLNKVMNNFNDDFDFTNDGKTGGYGGKLGEGRVGLEILNDGTDLGRINLWTLRNTQGDDVLTKLGGVNRNNRNNYEEEDTYTGTGGRLIDDINDDLYGNYGGGVGGERIFGGGRLVGGGRTGGLNYFDMNGKLIRTGNMGDNTGYGIDMDDVNNDRSLLRLYDPNNRKNCIFC